MLRTFCQFHHLAQIGLLLGLLSGIILSGSITLRAETAVPTPTQTNPSTDIIVLFAAPSTTQASRAGERSSTQPDALVAYGRRLTETHQQFLHRLHQMGINAGLRHDFTYLLNGMALTVNSGDTDQLAALPGVYGVFPDAVVHLNLAESVPLIGADHVWQMTDAQQQPITGQGVRVAIIDTGIDYTHPDLGDCFGSGCKVADGYDLFNDDADPLDDNGHGTHCAGIIAADGKMTGVAPHTTLLAYKVLDANGVGTISGIIAGMERATDPDQNPATADAVDIISLSLGYPGAPGDPWSLAVEAAAAQGILVVVAAGNNGSDYSSLDSPGLTPSAFAVGASTKSDTIAPFSSRGPLVGYPQIIKPDIVAPGDDIVSTWPGGSYASADGTSMATPHVAGAAALVWQAHPSWTAEMVRANLMNTAVSLNADIYTQGAGRVQVDKAVLATAVATPGMLGLGLVPLDQPEWSVSRTIWITNTTTVAQTYTLAVSGPLLNDKPPLVSASLSSTQLTLGGGQSAPVTFTLTLTPLRTPPDLARNGGMIHIQSGSTVLTVPFAYQVPPLFSESRVLPFALQTSYDIALGDLDGDGDLDAFVGNTAYYDNPANTVWLNNGLGNFVDSGQRLGNAFTQAVALGDLDGDGDLDVFVTNGDEWDPQPDKVWFNDGHGTFSSGTQSLGNAVGRDVALGDLDGDGDLDAFVANGDPAYSGGEPNTVWINNGAGLFSSNGQALGGATSQGDALGDLDGDGDLDAFVANGNSERGRNEPNEIWLNDGNGRFSDSGQRLGFDISQAVVLGDLDGDGDLDAFVANGGVEWDAGQPDKVWLNDGTAVFTDSGQLLGNHSSYGAAIGDLYADGIPDLFVAGYHGGNKVWLNDGHASLTPSDPGFGIESATAVALGDVDGDGDVDALVANAIGRQNRLWLNRGSNLQQSDDWLTLYLPLILRTP